MIDLVVSLLPATHRQYFILYSVVFAVIGRLLGPNIGHFH